MNSSSLSVGSSIFQSPSGQTAFHEITRRMPLEELQAVREKANSIPDLDQKAKELTRKFNAREMKLLITEPDYPYYGLRAVELGYLSQHQFGTLQKFWQVSERHQVRGDVIESIALFLTEGIPNPRARQLIEMTLTINQSRLPDAEPLMNDLQLDQWFKEMHKAPDSEQQFFVVPDLDPCSDELNALALTSENTSLTVSQAISARNGINLFSRFEEQGVLKRMVPSSDMVQAFLNVRSGLNAIRLNHVIGLSSIEDIRLNGLANARDVAIAFPGSPTPKLADDYLAPGTDFSYHDECYHALLASNMQPQDRYSMIMTGDVVGEVLKKIGPSEVVDAAILKALRDKFYDMEFPYYRTEVPITRTFDENDKFWHSLITELEAPSISSLLSSKQKIELMNSLVQYIPGFDERLKKGPEMATKEIVDSIEATIAQIKNGRGGLVCLFKEANNRKPFLSEINKIINELKMKSAPYLLWEAWKAHFPSYSSEKSPG